MTRRLRPVDNDGATREDPNEKGAGGELQQPLALIGTTTDQRKLQVTQQQNTQREAAKRRLNVDAMMHGRLNRQTISTGPATFSPSPSCLSTTSGGADACRPFSWTQQIPTAESSGTERDSD